jgi:serine/threonine protein kinase
MPLPHGLTLIERLSPRTAKVSDAQGTTRILKSVPEWATSYEEAGESIAQEASILKALRGRDVSADVILYDPTLRMLLLDWLPGAALDVRAERSPVAQLELARHLFTLLSRVHATGSSVVHADISPANMIEQADGGVRLIDFELGHQTNLRSVAIRSGAFRGTAHYAAPEVARSEPATSSSDVFSCAAVLLACSIHRAPRESQGASLLVEAAESRLQVPNTLPAALYKLLVQATEMAPEARPSATEALLLLGP